METESDKNNKYHNGKIYTLRSHQTDKYYIGSTCDALHKRFYKHKMDYKLSLQGKAHYVSSHEILQYDDCYTELLENVKCECKNELEKREGEFIRKHKNEVVNVIIVGRTQKEYKLECKEKIAKQRQEYTQKNKEQRKEYLLTNAEKIQERDKQYRLKNAEKIKQKGIEYYQLNKDKLKETQKKSYEKNKAKIMERQRIRRAKAKFIEEIIIPE